MENATDFRPDGLLPAAYDLAVRLGVRPGAPPGVRLRQTGRILLPQWQRWVRFRAEQTMSTIGCDFAWHAWAGPFGVISVTDALAGGIAALRVRALGVIPIATAAATPALARGELMRYLAELAWAPDAILHNRALRWRENGADSLIVSAGAGDTLVEVTLTLDNHGRIAGAFAPDRPRAAMPPILPTPWRGAFSDYRLHAGRWLPFAGEVGWEPRGVSDIYWQGQITDWSAQPGLA